ncbi:MAG: hypothetical protein N2512_05660, partial [Armatimonadetes bacterium]|nr:hypothetical protein [Armatimonadota bacterium]
DESHIPPRFIKGYEIGGGPWLMGMCLEPAAVYESWCHQRGYVCMIHDTGGRAVKVGDSFETLHLVGFFDSVGEAEAVFDKYAGARSLQVSAQGWRVVR